MHIYIHYSFIYIEGHCHGHRTMAQKNDKSIIRKLISHGFLKRGPDILLVGPIEKDMELEEEDMGLK